MKPPKGLFVSPASFGLLVTLLSVALARMSEVCPDFCICDMWLKLRRATCVNKNLYSVQTGLPAIVQALDLSKNSVSSLGNFELANTGLTRLKYLNLSGNSINEIDLNAFTALDDLAVLDLSRNHLYYVLQDTFANSKNLKILKLDENNFNSDVPQLRSSYIKNLSMSKCQIVHIPIRTFSGLRGLRSLDLSKNLIIHFDIRILKPLIFLRNLTLHGNPWVCDKQMQDLQAYTKMRRIALDDVCQKSTQPRKFEKMISIVQNQDKPDDINNYNDSYFWITDSPSRIECPDSNETTVTDSSDMLTTRLKKIPPYWIFVSGILIGSIISMVLTYVWASISRSILCTLPNIRRRNSRETHDVTSQRVSLLQNWQHGTETPSCPGTPPPPYREVMLHSGLYPSASTAIISRGNMVNVRAQRF